MSPSQVIQAIQQLLPRIKSSSAGAENILLEYANENNLEPAVLVKMAQTMNTARTLAFLEKNADSRGATFPLLNPDEIAAKYVEQAQNKKQAKTPTVTVDLGESTRVPNFFKMASAEVEGMTKAASVTEEPVVVKSARDLAREYNAQRDELDALNRDIEQGLELREELADNFKLAFKKLAKFLRDNRDDSQLIGEDIHALGTPQDIAVYSEAVKEASSYVNFKIDPFSGEAITKRKLVRDRFDVMPLVKEASEKLTLVEDVDFFVNTKQAQAGTLNPPSRKTSQKYDATQTWGNEENEKRETERKEFKKDSPLKLDFDLNQLLNKYKALDSNDGWAKRQRSIDEAYDDAATMATLQRLVITDPILAEADPVELVNMFNDLRVTKPDVARNTNMLRFALREALQYGGIPQQTVKTLADIDKSMVETALKRQDLLKRIYTQQ